MTYIRDTAPLAEPVCDPFYEPWTSQQARVMTHVIDSLFDRPSTGRLAAPCVGCGEHEIVCACVRQGEMM